MKTFRISFENPSRLRFVYIYADTIENARLDFLKLYNNNSYRTIIEIGA